MTTLGAWRSCLPAHASPERATEIGQDLIERWSEPHRRYHTLDHLGRMLSAVDDHADAAEDVDAVRLAAWFHDAIYDPKRTDNEIRSAELAADALDDLGLSDERKAEVIRLIWLTADHRVPPGDADGALLSDADLAILAVPPEDYAAYAEAIRTEYAHVPDDAFRAGRISVLSKILEIDHIYQLPALREAWEARARANMAAEIDGLRGE